MEKVLRNIQKILLNDDPSDDQKNKLWNSMSYYNFIQKVLDSSKDRPIEGDYIIGWDTFFKVVEVLNPDYCLFCGVSAINNKEAMINAAEKNSFYQRFDDKEKFMSAGVKARKLSIGKNGKEILVLCIVHPCYRFGFTSSEWRKFIDQHLKNYTTWLRGN